jgi:flagellar hook-associated protein 3 FlgL
MRIADKMATTQIDRNIQKNRTEMSGLQNQAATQKRINRPSDDPLAATRVLAARTDENSFKQYMQNITQAKSFIEYSEQALGELNEALVRAKELAISQASDAGASDETRRITAEEIGQIFQQSVQIGNRKIGDRYIFAGMQTLTQPFDQEGQYYGDDGDIKIQIHKDAVVGMNLAGSKVFLGQGIGGDGYIRTSPNNPKTVDDLQQLRQEDQEIRDLKEEEAPHQVQTRGLASTAGSAAKLSKQDPVNGSPGLNVFQTLKGLEISLKTNDKVGVQESLDLLDQAISQVVLARAELGSRVSGLNSTTDSLQKAVLDNKSMASQMEDVDVFKLVSDINKTESTLKATMETSSKMVQRSLLDFLR